MSSQQSRRGQFMSVLAAGSELALLPRESSRFPSTQNPSVPQIVERPFESAGDVVAGPVPSLCHPSGRCQAPTSRPANGIEIVVQLHPDRLEPAGPAVDQTRI